MQNTPLFFNSAGLIAGRGFIASVKIAGRCLLEHTGKDYFTFFGVNPGSAAGQGMTEAEAFRNFVDNIRSVLFDIADEASSFDAFIRELEEYVMDGNEPYEEAWRAAVEDRGSNRFARTEYKETIDAQTQPSIRVELVVGNQGDQTVAASRDIAPDLNQPGGPDRLLACA
jgi:hypothetical protein